MDRTAAHRPRKRELLPTDSDAAESLAAVLDRWSRPQPLLTVADQAGPAADEIEELFQSCRMRRPVVESRCWSKACAHASPGGAGPLPSNGRAPPTHRTRHGFSILYNETRHLFTIGFNLSMGRLDNSYYDLLASEAALTSFLTIARGEAHRRHWFQLGRPITRVGESLALVSWGGTMFEYLMPRLFLRSYPQTLLDETRLGGCPTNRIRPKARRAMGYFRIRLFIDRCAAELPVHVFRCPRPGAQGVWNKILSSHLMPH